MNSIETWQIQDTPQTDDLITYIRDSIITESLKKTYLLDTTRSTYTLLEKYVHDTAMFHLKRMNIDDMENHYIEFWCKTHFHTHRLHVDCDQKLEHIYKYPLLACVTYLNDSLNCPTIITNVDNDCYKFKEFCTQTGIALSIPKRNKQITFDGKFYHGCTTLSDGHMEDERIIIAINLWGTKPNKVDYYVPDTKHGLEFDRNPFITIEPIDTKPCIIPVSDDILNYEFFNDILYNVKKDGCFAFGTLLSNRPDECDNSTYNIMVGNSIKEIENTIQCKNIHCDIIRDIDEMTNMCDGIYNNRFLQRFVYPNTYCPSMCTFIINEYETFVTSNGMRTTDIPVAYQKTGLAVDTIPSIFPVIISTLSQIMTKISGSYELRDDISLNIRELCVVKYSHDMQNSLEMHSDGSFVSFSILLNDSNEFEGGGTYFADGLTTHLNQGDMLIHSSKVKYSELKITSGVSYLLVGCMNIDI